jgi:hypothetical protein
MLVRPILDLIPAIALWPSQADSLHQLHVPPQITLTRFQNFRKPHGRPRAGIKAVN